MVGIFALRRITRHAVKSPWVKAQSSERASHEQPEEFCAYGGSRRPGAISPSTESRWDIAIHLWPSALRTPALRRHVDRTHSEHAAALRTLLRQLPGLETGHGQLLAIPARPALFPVDQAVDAWRAARGIKPDPHRLACIAFQRFALDRNSRAAREEQNPHHPRCLQDFHRFTVSVPRVSPYGALC